MSEEKLPSAQDLDAKAAEQQAKESTNGEKIKLPICPYCGHDPFNLLDLPLNNDNGVTLIVMSCADCRKVISVELLHVPQPRVAASPSRILLPGRPQ